MNFTTKDLIPVTVAVIIFGGMAIFLLQLPSNQKITSFEECISEGFPAMESHPHQCRAGGVTFTEVLEGVPVAPLAEDETLSLGSEMIKVSLPPPNALVSSPFTVRGEARGLWYFEASFPVMLLDGNGEELAVGIAQAQGEWMTENFVPFAVELSYDTPKTDTGILILAKDNPSGLPENDQSIKIPVRFK